MYSENLQVISLPERARYSTAPTRRADISFVCTPYKVRERILSWYVVQNANEEHAILSLVQLLVQSLNNVVISPRCWPLTFPEHIILYIHFNFARDEKNKKNKRKK